MGVVTWIDRLQRRHPVLGYPLGVIYKFFDDGGGYLAAMLAYYAFVSLFPALLLLSTVLSIVLRNDLAQTAIDAAERGDTSELMALVRVHQRPFDAPAADARYAEPAAALGRRAAVRDEHHLGSRAQ